MVVSTIMAGCSQPIAPQVAKGHVQVPSDFPEAYYQQAKVTGSTILQINPSASLVTIVVGRGGPLHV